MIIMYKTKLRFLLLAGMAMVFNTVAYAAADGSIKTLLLEAIDAKDGTSKGALTGGVSEKFSSATGSMSPVMAHVTTEKSFKQEGCKRLNVRISQENVKSQNGSLGPFFIDYGFNICRDGNPPDLAE